MVACEGGGNVDAMVAGRRGEGKCTLGSAEPPPSSTGTPIIHICTVELVTDCRGFGDLFVAFGGYHTCLARENKRGGCLPVGRRVVFFC